MLSDDSDLMIDRSYDIRKRLWMQWIIDAYGLTLAGWSSHNLYALLGGLRSAGVGVRQPADPRSLRPRRRPRRR